MKRLNELCHPNDPPPTRRGLARQRPIRERESLLRGHIVELTRWTKELGLSLPETAHLLHLAPRTLRDWRDDFAIEMPPLPLLGRPTQRSPREDRTAVLDVLNELGPTIPLATLRECFPDMARAELADLLKRYRRVWRKRYEAAPWTLLWRRVGAVWAMDFSEAPHAIDGNESYLFAVRDLASHQQLLWLPTPDLSADTAITALRTLFTLQGAPLVLKADNGSAFIAEAMRDFLSPFGVSLLFSPPYTPRYNGAIEAGIGSLKTRTERYADREGHPGYWTLDNVCAAQIEANATARPRGETGPTPDQSWSTRRPLTPAERQQFQETVAHQRELWNEQEASSNKEDRRMQREAIRRALVEHGILLFSRRRLPLPITTQKTAIIT